MREYAVSPLRVPGHVNLQERDARTAPAPTSRSAAATAAAPLTAGALGRFPEFRDRIAALSLPLRASEVLRPELLIERDGPLEIYYAPMDWVRSAAKVAIVGITPGKDTMRIALETAAAGLRAGEPEEVFLDRVKSRASFSGMRKQLITLARRARSPSSSRSRQQRRALDRECATPPPPDEQHSVPGTQERSQLLGQQPDHRPVADAAPVRSGRARRGAGANARGAHRATRQTRRRSAVVAGGAGSRRLRAGPLRLSAPIRRQWPSAPAVDRERRPPASGRLPAGLPESAALPDRGNTPHSRRGAVAARSRCALVDARPLRAARGLAS